jgi:F0F1-type ATP synthase assembly protein I
MAGIIGGGVWLGYWLDGRYNTQTPWFTIGIGLFSIFVALYISLKDFFKKQ